MRNPGHSLPAAHPVRRNARRSRARGRCAAAGRPRPTRYAAGGSPAVARSPSATAPSLRDSADPRAPADRDPHAASHRCACRLPGAATGPQPAKLFLGFGERAIGYQHLAVANADGVGVAAWPEPRATTPDPPAVHLRSPGRARTTGRERGPAGDEAECRFRAIASSVRRSACPQQGCPSERRSRGHRLGRSGGRDVLWGARSVLAP